MLSVSQKSASSLSEVPLLKGIQEYFCFTQCGLWIDILPYVIPWIDRVRLKSTRICLMALVRKPYLSVSTDFKRHALTVRLGQRAWSFGDLLAPDPYFFVNLFAPNSLLLVFIGRLPRWAAWVWVSSLLDFFVVFTAIFGSLLIIGWSNWRLTKNMCTRM